MTTLQAIEARLREATPGPWLFIPEIGWICGPAGQHAHLAQIRGWGYLTGRGGLALGLSSADAHAIQMGNGQFIAHAPSDIAWLLARITELEQEAVEMRSAVSYR